MSDGNVTNGFKDKFYQEKLDDHEQRLKELASEMNSLKESHAVIEYATRDLKEATEKIDDAVDRLGEKLVNKIEDTVDKEMDKHAASCPIRQNPEFVVKKSTTIREKTLWTSIGTAIAAGAAYAIKLLVG